MARVKKQPEKKNVVTPDPKNIKVGVAFEDLDEGDYFVMEGRLYQRIEEGAYDQAATDVLTGDLSDDLCNEKVIPVNVTITWETK